MLLKKWYAIYLLVLLFAAACTPEHSKIVVAEFNNNKILLDEFEKAYAKNSGGFENAENDSIDKLENFLDLYVNYKMKLRDAEVRGYTNDPDMQKEYLDYKITVGSALFLEKEFFEPKLREMYEKRKVEFRVAHIFLLPDSTRNDEQTKNFAAEIIERINNGEDWVALAKQYSGDHYTKDKGGEVGFITSGQILNIDLENAIYNTEPGKLYPEPIKTNYGYHVIKVMEKYPRKNSIKAAHILAGLRNESEVVDSSEALQKIKEVQKKLSEGRDFRELALEYSDDKGSAAVGGELGFFGRGSMVPEFENVAFKLQPGQISDIVKTRFGYHLIKLIDIAPEPDFEEAKKDLRNLYQRTFYNTDYAKFVENLKKELRYSLNNEAYQKILDNIDSIRVGEKYWENPVRQVLGNDIIFSLAGRGYSCDSLFAYAELKKLNLDRPLNISMLNNIVDTYSSAKVITEKALMYDQKDPEFAILMEDYKSGIYLFKILEEEVWSQLMVDSAKVMAYYEQVKENYRWNNRVEYKEIRVLSDSIANFIYAELQNNAHFDSLMLKYDKNRYDKNFGLSGLVGIDENDLSKRANGLSNLGEYSEPISYQNSWSIIQLIRKEEPRIKTYDEVKMELTSIIQERETKRLEDEYINSLKNIYKPKYYYNELTKAFKK